MFSIKFPGPATFFPKVSCLKNYRKKHGKFPRIPNIYDVKHWAVVSWAFFMNLVPLMLIPVVGSNIHIWSKRVKLTVGSRDLSQVEKKKILFSSFCQKKMFSFRMKIVVILWICSALQSHNSHCISSWDKSCSPTVNWSLLKQI